MDEELTGHHARLLAEAIIKTARAAGATNVPDDLMGPDLLMLADETAGHIAELEDRVRGFEMMRWPEEARRLKARAEAAEATLAKVAALADEWDDTSMELSGPTYAHVLRAALASAGRPATSDGKDANGEEVDYGWMTGRLSARPASPVAAPSATTHCGRSVHSFALGGSAPCARPDGHDGQCQPGLIIRSTDLAPSATDEDGALTKVRAALRREVGEHPSPNGDGWQPMVAAHEVRTLLDALDAVDPSHACDTTERGNP